MALAALAALCAGSTSSPGRGGHTWAVVVDASRFWFNYRHVSGVLGVYQGLKAGGLSDQHVREVPFKSRSSCLLYAPPLLSDYADGGRRHCTIKPKSTAGPGIPLRPSSASSAAQPVRCALDCCGIRPHHHPRLQVHP